MIYFWFPVMVSWLIKWLLVKQRGLGAYRKGVPFFLGLMMGEFMIGSLLSVFGTAFNTRVYAFWVY